MNLKFENQYGKRVKIKSMKVLGLIPTFVEVTGEKLVGGTFLPPPPITILNRVKHQAHKMIIHTQTIRRQQPKARELIKYYIVVSKV